MHRVVIASWLVVAAVFFATGMPAQLAVAGAAGAWSLSLVQRYLGEPE